MYIYFGFNYCDVEDSKVIPIYEEVEHDCREEIIRCGGSISHHHGVGKIRKRFMKKTHTPMGLEMMQDIKKAIDPKNIFAINNTIYNEEGEEEEERKNHSH